MSGAFDFYSPFMAAAIIQDPDNPEGSRFPLWTNDMTDAQRSLLRRGAADIPGSEALQTLSFLTEMTVELQLAYLPKITATLNPPYREGLAFLDSPLVEWGSSILEVQFGYAGGAPEGPVLSPVLSGTLLKPEVTIGQDISIVLNAQGVGGFIAARQMGIRDYSNWKRRDIIDDLITTIGLLPDFSEVEKVVKERSAFVETIFAGTGASAVEIEAAATEEQQKHPIEQRVVVSQAGLTIWLLLWKLVRESECWMNIVGKTMHVLPRNSVMTGEPKYTLRLFDYHEGRIGPAENTFPILSASSPTSAIYLPASTRGFLIMGYDPKERVQVTQKVDERTSNTHASGKGQTQANPSATNPAFDEKKGEGAGIASNDSATDQLNQQLVAEMQGAREGNMGVKLEIETLGIPDILPGEVVAVRGLGSRFEGGSGNYGVFKVVHTVGSGGYTTRLEIVSNVGALAGTFDKTTIPTSQINTAKPPEPDAPKRDNRQAKKTSTKPRKKK